MKKIIRVFPRQTRATPEDADVRIAKFPGLFDEADKVFISVAFTWDIPFAELLYKKWKYVADTEIGGPAFGQPGGEFVPGLFLKKGYTITSRGCPNKCWFCSVWKREPELKELKIKDGFNLLDDNILACSEDHIQKVFTMLKKQKEKPMFTGGLEAKLLTEKRAKQLLELKTKEMFFAYDTPDDYEPLVEAGKTLFKVGFSNKSHLLQAYVLIGYPGDDTIKAEARMVQTIRAGFFPRAMLYKNKDGSWDKQTWSAFRWKWSRPLIIGAMMKEVTK